MTPKETGEAIEKAFEGKLPESFTEKLVRESKKLLLSDLIKAIQKDEKIAILRKKETQKANDHAEYEFYAGEIKGYLHCLDHIYKLERKL